MPDSDNITWLEKVARLNVYRAKGGPAPQKPLLLLLVLELAENNELAEQLLLTPELAFRFATFYSVVAHRRSQRPDVRIPFYHLQSEGFWRPLDERRQPAAHYRQAQVAEIAPDFLRFASESGARDQARRLLVAKYFQLAERPGLYALLGMDVPSDEQIVADGHIGQTSAAQTRGRVARFRLDVVAAYNYACALTGLRLTTITVGSIVDAAHIHQFAKSRNNDPRNGMALCKNAHWLFDNGLWSLDDDYRVLVARQRFSEHAPDQKALTAYAGERVRLPSAECLWPDRACLAWHRRHTFQG
jgi:putative restriction endonuclease